MPRLPDPSLFRFRWHLRGGYGARLGYRIQTSRVMNSRLPVHARDAPGVMAGVALPLRVVERGGAKLAAGIADLDITVLVACQWFKSICYLIGHPLVALAGQGHILADSRTAIRLESNVQVCAAAGDDRLLVLAPTLGLARMHGSWLHGRTSAQNQSEKCQQYPPFSQSSSHRLNLAAANPSTLLHCLLLSVRAEALGVDPYRSQPLFR